MFVKIEENALHFDLFWYSMSYSIYCTGFTRLYTSTALWQKSHAESNPELSLVSDTPWFDHLCNTLVHGHGRR